MIYTKNCPKCGLLQKYTSNISFKSAVKKNKLCVSCSQSLRCSRDERLLRSQRMKGKCSGSSNFFYSRKHTSETKKKLSEIGKITCKLRKETRNNYDIWIDKYGKDEADKRMTVYRQKQSLRSSGKNNPMYGKPSPTKSGCGWSGWYKGWYFRSLRELSYVIKELEANHLEWCSAETSELRIPYTDWNGRERTYTADFLVGNKLIEIKPQKLHKTPSVMRKAEAAIKFCENTGRTYILTDVIMLSNDEINALYKTGEIVFTPFYEKLYRARNTS